MNLKSVKKFNLFQAAIFALLSIFALLIYTTWHFINNQRAEIINAQLHDHANDFALEMAETLRLSVENLRAASGVVIHFDDITFQQFQGVSNHYFKTDAGLIIIEWQPVIKQQDRTEFEKNTQRDLPNFRLWEPDFDGKPIPAKPKKEHVAVLYMASKNRDENDINTLGLDLAWSSERMLSKLQARDSGRAQSSELFRVVTNQSSDYKPLGFAITLPVYKEGYIPSTEEQRQQNLIGYMAGVYCIKTLMTPKLNELLLAGYNIDIHDHLDNEHRLILQSGEYSEFATDIDMDFFGNTLTLSLAATEDLVKKQFKMVWIILPVILAIFALFSFSFLYILAIKNKNLNQAQAELINLNNQLEDLSRHDPLTGLFNRRAFAESLTNELNRLERNKHTVALLMLDLDFFKTINDRWGHPTGDKALKEFSLCCKRESRNIDIIGRLGGEEFAILLTETSEKHICNFAERLRHSIEELRININNSEQVCHLTVSIGISMTNTPMAAEKLIEQADKALYLAKQNGRNRIEIFQQS